MNEEPKKSGFGKKLGIGCLVVIGVLVGLTILGAIVGPTKTAGTASEAPSSEAVEQSRGDQAPTPAQADAVAPVEEPEVPSLTGPQSNAARSAQQYLSMTGFSRDGLIGQLSSESGDQYDVADATAAVDSLGVDWNEQAVRSAKQYLSMSGFSCSGLIDQLSSDSGDKYTRSQATFGAKQAGAC